VNDLLQSLMEVTAIHWIATHPWVLLIGFSAPLLFLALTKRIYPNKWFVVLFVVPTLLTYFVGGAPIISRKHGLVSGLGEQGAAIGVTFFGIVLLLDLIILIIAMVDLFTVARRRWFSAERQCMKIASLRQNHRVTLMISNHSSRSFKMWLRDGLPQEFAPNPKQFVVQINGRGRVTLHYEFRASRRGAFSLDVVHMRFNSFLGLWKSFLDCPVTTVIHVYPDMKQLAEYAVLARTNRLSVMGVRRTRKIGLDNEFERLRDYTRDDNYKHIDWRTTARRNKLTVKDFQTNQSQRIIFMVDCGRMMTNEAAGLSLLDHAFNAVLLMSYVALRQGDSVGLVCFSNEIHTFVPPRSGMKQMNQLLHASFDRFPQLVESRYDEAFLYLRTHCPKRALVVLITNVIDEVNSHQIEQYLGSIVGRHLPLAVLIRDHRLFDAADHPVGPEDSLYRAAAAAEILTWRHQVLGDLQGKGVLALDIFPEEMTASLVNRYLDIKARHLL